ncbi:hypothetical protein M422DRAFT_64254 [Sphaerobolus stellatus SS14]|nr:hypothetical protein M422DRAFT_64254 [Sphaerobolus stellatus SS14]
MTSQTPGMPFSAISDVESRKRRRNRMRASCLNCYASKRKTNLCVYEMEEQAVFDQNQTDEINRLRRRVLDLESTILGLKNKYHPRWSVQEGIPRFQDSTSSESLSHRPRGSPRPHHSDENCLECEYERYPGGENHIDHISPSMNEIGQLIPSPYDGSDTYMTSYSYSSPTVSERSEDTSSPLQESATFSYESTGANPLPGFPSDPEQAYPYQHEERIPPRFPPSSIWESLFGIREKHYSLTMLGATLKVLVLYSLVFGHWKNIYIRSLLAKQSCPPRTRSTTASLAPHNLLVWSPSLVTRQHLMYVQQVRPRQFPRNISPTRRPTGRRSGREIFLLLRPHVLNNPRCIYFVTPSLQTSSSFLGLPLDLTSN